MPCSHNTMVANDAPGHAWKCAACGYVYGPGDETLLRQAMVASGQPQKDLATAELRWNTDGLQRDFEVIGFAAPFVVVVRKADGVKGSLEFTHSPRVYFNFVAD